MNGNGFKAASEDRAARLSNTAGRRGVATDSATVVRFRFSGGTASL